MLFLLRRFASSKLRGGTNVGVGGGAQRYCGEPAESLIPPSHEPSAESISPLSESELIEVSPSSLIR